MSDMTQLRWEGPVLMRYSHDTKQWHYAGEIVKTLGGWRYVAKAKTSTPFADRNACVKACEEAAS